MYPNHNQYLQEEYRDATTPPFGYLFIDLKQEIQANLRLRANILRSRQQVYAPGGTKVNEI